MKTEEEFKEAIETFLDETGMAPTTLGVKALNDPNFVRDIRDGATCGLRRADRVIKFIEENSPTT